MIGLLTFLALQLGGMAIIALSAWIFGRAALARGPGLEPGCERVAIPTLLGLGLLAQALLAIGLLGLLRREVVLVLLVAGHLLCWRTWRRMLLALRHGSLPSARLALVAIVTVAPVVALGLYPATGFDATMYHLPYVEAFLAAEGVPFLADLRFPVFPQLAEMGFTLAFLLAGEAAAHLTQALAFVLTAGVLYAWVSRRLSQPTALLASALWLGCPLAVYLGGTAYIDLSVTAFATGALYAWQRHSTSGDPRWLALAGGLGGFAAAVKYLGLFFCAVLVVLAGVSAARRRSWRALGWMLLAMVAAASPWYLRILIHTGNPLFPFYPEIFGASDWAISDGQAIAARGPVAADLSEALVFAGGETVRALKFLLLVPWNSVMHRQVFNLQAPLSPWYLLVLPLGVPLSLLRGRPRWPGIVTISYLLFWLTTLRDPRYLLPILPVLHCSVFAGLQGWIDRLSRRRLAAVAILLVLPGWLYGVYKLREQGPLPTTTAGREGYLADRVAGYRALRWLEENADGKATVYTLYGENLRYYTRLRAIGDWFGPVPYARVERVLSDPEALATELDGLGARYLLVPREVITELTREPSAASRVERVFTDEDSVVYRVMF